MELRFVYPELLFLLWIVLPLAAWWYHAAMDKEKRMRKFVAPRMQARLRPPRSMRRSFLQAAMICLALILSLIATARPQWGKRDQTTYAKGRDIVIALDVSRSMLAEDIHPNRLQRAKADIMDLVRTLQGDRAALVAFRNGARLLCPLTTDYAFLRQALEGADTYSAPRGPTDLQSSVAKALDAFESKSASHKAIVLVSDGEDLSGEVAQAGKRAAERGIPIYSVGLGSASGSKIPDPDNPGEYITYKGKPVRSRLKHEALRTLAEKSGGAYIAIGTAGTAEVTLGNLYQDHLRRITARSLHEEVERIYIDRFQYFLFPATILFLAAMFLSNGRLSLTRRQSRTMPMPHNSSAMKPLVSTILIAFATVCLQTFARGQEQTNTVAEKHTFSPEKSSQPDSKLPIPPGREGGRIAENLYRAGKYIKAAEAYIEASGEASDSMKQTLLYNAAVAYYRAQKYEDAKSLLGQLSRQSSPPEGTSQALGTALHKQALNMSADNSTNALRKAELLRQSAEAFRSALSKEPENDSLRHDIMLTSERSTQAEKHARKAELLDKYGKTPPFAIMDRMLNAERDIIHDMKAAFTNDSPEQIYQLEELASQQNNTSDLWIPLRSHMEKATQASTNKLAAKQAADLQKISDSTEMRMRKTARLLKDLDTAALESASSAERRIYGFWKPMAPYRKILEEDLRRQTNSIALNKQADQFTQAANEALIEQQECADLSKLFSERFNASARTETATPRAETEQDKTLTSEKKEEILKLASRAEKEQSEAARLIEQGNHTSALTSQGEAYRILEKIRDMLPPEKESDQNKQQDQNKQEKQKRQGQTPEPQDKPQQPQPNDQQPPPKEEQKPDESEDQKKAGKKDIPEDVQQILRKALQRQKEHELEKQRRRTRTPLQPFEKDW